MLPSERPGKAKPPRIYVGAAGSRNPVCAPAAAVGGKARKDQLTRAQVPPLRQIIRTQPSTASLLPLICILEL